MLRETPCYKAPDGSSIRSLLSLNLGGLAHCILPPDRISQAVCHKTVEEIWFFISGIGKLWRKYRDEESVVTVKKGICITIPANVAFQFRNTGNIDLEFLISTMPPWPGLDEAAKIEQGYWEYLG